MSGSSPLARGTRDNPGPHDLDGRFIPARAGNTEVDRCREARPAVHPRSRGEHLGPACLADGGVGSSPLARGTPVLDGQRHPEPRFIPARAGNTRRRCVPRPARSVHPRSRGEHGAHAPGVATSTGSSPLARGTLRVRNGVLRRQRFIPARAGNTARPRCPAETRPVHPRSRGEHRLQASDWTARAGSSPLARGTRRPHRRGRAPGRFIPARAGNTGPSATGDRMRPVHPRSRGEHPATPPASLAETGSSPLARGTLSRFAYEARPTRFIPARAGNTARGLCVECSTPVHPRSRGEHRPELDVTGLAVGSSPLARGTRAQQAIECALDRFIPARAGNTSGRGRSSPPMPVHPRSRGEHDEVPPRVAAVAGSSPLARGTR